MFTTFEDQAFLALEKAEKKAIEYNLPYIGTEHLLVGISYQTESFASKLLTKYGLSSTIIEKVLIESYMTHNMMSPQLKLLLLEKQPQELKTLFQEFLKIKWSQLQTVKPKDILSLNRLFWKKKQKEEPVFTPKLRRLLRKCYLYSYHRADAVTIELLLVILLIRQDNFVRDILRETDVPLQRMIRDLHFHIRQTRKNYFRLILNKETVIRFPANEDLAVKVLNRTMNILQKDMDKDRYVEIKNTIKNRLGELQFVLNKPGLKQDNPDLYKATRRQYKNLLESYIETYENILQTDAEGRQIYRQYFLRQKRDLLDKDLPFLGRLIDEIHVRCGTF